MNEMIHMIFSDKLTSSDADEAFSQYHMVRR